MKELIKELRADIYNCGIDASYEGDNFADVSEAIATLDKLEKAINYTRCSTQLKGGKYTQAFIDQINILNIDQKCMNGLVKMEKESTHINNFVNITKRQ